MATGIGGFELIERTLRRETFGTPTVGENGRPHATGVVHAASPRGEPLILYATTRSANPDVAFVVPASRRPRPGFRPRAVQFQGMATIVPSEHDLALRAFDSSWLLRIRSGPKVFTYGIGMPDAASPQRPRPRTDSG